MYLQVVSEAARQLPEEVYKAPKAGAGKTEEVAGTAPRKRSRAAHKRAFKNRSDQEVSTSLSFFAYQIFAWERSE